MILTILEIKQIAEFCGLIVSPIENNDDNETEIAIQDCPLQGVDDDGKVIHSKYICYFEEYPDEGVYPIGSANPTNHPTFNS